MAPLTAYLSNVLTITTRSPLSPPNLHPRTNNLSPRAITKPQPPKDPNYHPGAGTISPTKVNNHGFFALFALLGVFLVLLSIWFFFWAKNGGFHFRKGDWEDYKSTVLRRKGPNGTTLSGATKTTRLGGGSVVAHGAGDVGRGVENEKEWVGVGGGGGKKGGKGKRRGKKNGHDDDVRAYRHEKVAKVGGLNREADGVFNQDFAYSDTATSYADDLASQPSSIPASAHIPINTPRAKNENRWARGKTCAEVHPDPTTPSPKKKNTFYNQTPTSNASTDSHRPLRPNAASPAGASTPTRSRHSSPTKGRARNSVPGSFRDSYTESLDFESRYSYSEAGVTEDSRGTKTYFHPIPGLGSERGGGGGAGEGFRRGRGRRDSLSDSEGETVMS